MVVGDFLYLLDKMCKECSEHKSCNECKYGKCCYTDISAIDSMSIRKAVEGYAEINGLLNSMQYIDDQKQIPCSTVVNVLGGQKEKQNE